MTTTTIKNDERIPCVNLFWEVTMSTSNDGEIGWHTLQITSYDMELKGQVRKLYRGYKTNVEAPCYHSATLIGQILINHYINYTEKLKPYKWDEKELLECFDEVVPDWEPSVLDFTGLGGFLYVAALNEEEAIRKIKNYTKAE